MYCPTMKYCLPGPLSVTKLYVVNSPANPVQQYSYCPPPPLPLPAYHSTTIGIHKCNPCSNCSLGQVQLCHSLKLSLQTIHVQVNQNIQSHGQVFSHIEDLDTCVDIDVDVDLIIA